LDGFALAIARKFPVKFAGMFEKTIAPTKAGDPELAMMHPSLWNEDHWAVIAAILTTLPAIAEFAGMTSADLEAEWNALTHTSAGSVGTVSEKTFRQITAPPADGHWRGPAEILQDIFDRVASARSAGLIYEDAEI
jgi:hypothetical protein